MPATQIRGTNVLNGTISRDDLDINTVGKAVVSNIIQGSGITLSSTGGESGTGAVTISATGSPPSLSGVELSLGGQDKKARNGNFQITGLTGLSVGKPVLVSQALGPYTGKGTRLDEAEMDSIVASGKVISSSVIQCYWSSRTIVKGNIKFNYMVGA